MWSEASADPTPSSASLLKAKGLFELYLDPTDDPDIREILVVRKRPSRVRGVGWCVEVGGEADDPPPMPQPMGERLVWVVRKKDRVR